MNLSTLKPPKGAHHKTKRLGRGVGSGHGKTSTRGHKGQYAHAGSKRRFAKEGGQMPLHRRLPKRGFSNPFRVEYEVVNLGDLSKAGTSGRIDVNAMRQLNLVRKTSLPIKVLGNGTLSGPVCVVAHAFSKTAEEKITAAGGTCERIPLKTARKESSK